MANVFELIDRMVGSDARDRLTGAGPHLYVFRTTDSVLCRCHADLGIDVAESLERVALTERGRQRDWPRQYGEYLAILASVGPVKAVRAGLLYRVVDPPEGVATRITRANADLLRDGLDEWLPDVDAGRLIYATVVDGRAVSICASVNTVEEAHAAGVETLPSYRLRGLAAQAVAAWAGAVLRMNATPFYGTTFDNLASQGVARRLAMQLVGAEFSVECALVNGGQPPF
jgi:GNAT superfamily N-acetyltransferase